MGMAQRPLGGGTLTLRGMVSADPLMGKSGYPLLKQTGETADGRTQLTDRQHPHAPHEELGRAGVVARMQTRRPVHVAAWRAHARAVITPLFNRMGWTARPGEADNAASLRTAVIAALGELDDAGVVAEANRRFAVYRADPGSLDRRSGAPCSPSSPNTRTPLPGSSSMAWPARRPQLSRRRSISPCLVGRAIRPWPSARSHSL